MSYCIKIVPHVDVLSTLLRHRMATQGHCTHRLIGMTGCCSFYVIHFIVVRLLPKLTQLSSAYLQEIFSKLVSDSLTYDQVSIWQAAIACKAYAAPVSFAKAVKMSVRVTMPTS